MSRIVNINSINPITFEYQIYSVEDDSLIFNTNIDATFDPTLDVIEYFVYDLNNQIVYSNVAGYPGYSINDTSVVLDPEKDLISQGFTIGQYNTVYNFVSPKLASNSTNPYFISQISADRTEVRLDTTAIPNALVISSTTELINDINSTSADYYDFYLDFGDNELVIALNALLDTTDPNNPTVLIKLYEPLPQQFDINSQLWVVTQIAEPVAYNIDINETFNFVDNSVNISGPNYNLNINDQINNSTNYINYNSLTATSSSYSQGTGSLKYQLNNILAQTGINVNIDYSDYANFVHFSSAQTRLENFYYKLSLLEQYTYSASFSSNSSSGSYYVSSSNIIWQTKINEIITTFDDYEYYLYYTSGSTSWPKTNSSPPFINASTSSIAGQSFFISQSGVAELYDLENNNALTLAIPSYITEDPDNAQFELFVEMIGQLFDNIFIYLQNITTKNDADNRLTYGVSKDLVADILRDMGITIYQNNFSSNDVYQALIGLTPSGSLYNLPFTTTQYPVPTGSFLEYITTYVTASLTSSLYPTDDINKEQYKRIYHNLPLLLKKKGSVAGLRDLITTYGVTDTILRINEFGGKDRNPNSYDNWQDEYNYALYTSGSSYVSSSFVLNSAWGATSNSPQAVEFRFKTNALPFNTSSVSDVTLFDAVGTISDRSTIKLRYTGSGYTSGSYSGSIKNPYYQYALLDFIPDAFSNPSVSASVYLPFYNEGWWSVLVNTSGSTGYTLYAANKNYEGEDGNVISFQASSSVTVTQTPWNDTTVAYFGGVASPVAPSFSGSFQEIRYYSRPITNNNFNAYVMNPYSIESSDYLAFRASLGGELFTGSTSIHPKVSGSWITTSSFASNSNFSILGNYSYFPNTEIFYFDQVPAGIQNAVSNKIKQQTIILPYSSSDANIPNANVLSPYRSIQQFPAISSSYTRDIDYVEVGFSPQNEINEDINSTLGYFNLGDVIGDSRFQSSSAETYPALDAIRDAYFQKYTSNYQEFDYIRLIEFFDNSLFKIVQDWSPARTSLAAGIIIKNTLLDRNRYPVPQVSPSSSIAFIGSGSGSVGIPYVVEDQTITGSIESGFITGSEGGSFPELFGQTSSVFAYPNVVNVTQSWEGSTPSLSGSVPFTQSSQEEFFNGQLSGSNLVVTTGDLSDCQVEIIQVYTTGSINGPFTGITFYYFPSYDFETDKTYYLTFTEANDALALASGSIQITDSSNVLGNQRVIYSGSGDLAPGSSRTINNLEVQGIVPPLIFSNNNVLAYLTVTAFTASVAFIDQDCEVLYGDNQIPRPSYKYMSVDFNNSQIVAVNEQTILNGNATRAAVPDSYYTSARQINSRYIGKELAASNLNKWTEGDVSYGKSVTVGNPEVNFVYFNNVGSTSPEWGNNLSSKTQTNIRLIINDSGSVTKPINDAEGINLGTIQQSFVDSGNATLVLDDYDTFGVNLNNLNGTWPIFKSGVSIAPILYTQTASYNNNGDIIGYGYTGSITFVQGQQGPDVTKNDYQLLTYGINFNPVDAIGLPVTLNFSKPVVLGAQSFFSTSSDAYNPTGSLANLSSDGYILKFQAHIEANDYYYAIVDYAIFKNSVEVARTQVDHLASKTGDIFYTDASATISDLYTVKAIAYSSLNFGGDDPVVQLNAASYFRVTQFPLPGTGVCNSFWTTGSGTPNILLASTSSTGLNNFIGQRQQNIERSGFNPISLDFEPQLYDEIRFQGIEDLAYSIINITSSNGQLKLQLDGNVPNGTNLSYFLLRRYVNDPSNIILDLDKPAGASSGGVLKPEYVTDNLNKNLDSILQNLKSKGLI
jgi:hypothetical protein